jgi:hypothetical protein
LAAPVVGAKRRRRRMIGIVKHVVVEVLEKCGRRTIMREWGPRFGRLAARFGLYYNAEFRAFPRPQAQEVQDEPRDQVRPPLRGGVEARPAHNLHPELRISLTRRSSRRNKKTRARPALRHCRKSRSRNEIGTRNREQAEERRLCPPKTGAMLPEQRAVRP